MLNKIHFLKILQSNSFIAFIIAFSATYFLFPVFFDVALHPLPGVGDPWITLDPSWQIALSKVNIDHMQWGKDFAFTYGPLSYLSTRIGWGIEKYQFILFDLFVSFNFFYIFYISYLKSNNKTLTVVLILISAFLLPSRFGSGTALILSAFLIFWIRQSLDGDKVLYYLLQIALVVLLFFIKFNTGLVSFIFFFAGLIYKAVFTKQNKFILAVYFAVPFLIILILSKTLNVALLDYLNGGMNMVSGYNEIMYLKTPYVNELRFAPVLILLALGVIMLKAYVERKQIFKNLVVLFLFSSTAYILYKQAFTRGDIQHIMEFYKYILLFVLCVQDFHFDEINKHTNSMVVTVVFISLFFAKRREEHLFMFKSRLLKTEYFERMKIYTDTSSFCLIPNYNQISQSVKDKVGKRTVDAYPWNIDLLFENELNYSPRPTPQAYTAYTPYLENLNFKFYNSAKAPDFVFYEFESIDGRYPLFDESKLNLILLKKYNCVDTFIFAGRPVLVLEKNKTASGEVKLQKIKEFEIDSTSLIVPKADSYYELHVSNTLKGKIRSFLRYSPELLIIINTKDGTERKYRISKKLLETGIFSNYYFSSTRDFYHMIKKDSLNPANEITGYRIQNLNSTFFENKIKVIEYKIN